ncbi:hypothetical protein M885DRAFT_543295 [Pelagophyceae sp. CCMP2097]|nr:hypothetical protein M885DRAFT_543295 [Pelagophyceae sp. CCMP2097]
MRTRVALLGWCSAAAAARPVAVCISGLARSFGAADSDVQLNIWASMVLPIRREADVFFAVDASQQGSKYVDDGGAWARARRTADGARRLFRPEAATFAPSASLAESLARCMAHVAARERARGRKYVWVVRLRPDATYGGCLPPYADWPRLAAGARVAWGTYLGRDCSRGYPRQAAQRGVCVDDNFAVMSRGAADAYFGTWPGGKVASKDCHTAKSGCAECRLGCALRRAGIRVGSLNVNLQLERPQSTRPGRANEAAPRPQTRVARLAGHARNVTVAAPATAPRSTDAAAFASFLTDVWPLVSAKERIGFVVVEPCGDALVQIDYAPQAKHAAAPAKVHGLDAPHATRDNDWRGCAVPPIDAAGAAPKPTDPGPLLGATSL